MRDFLINIKSENRIDKIRLIMIDDDVIGGQPNDSDNEFTSNTPLLDLACTMKFTIDAVKTAQETADNAGNAASTADKNAGKAQESADAANQAAGTAQKRADDAFNRVKPIEEGGTGAKNAETARTNLGLKSAATLDKTDVFGTSTNLVATQLLVDKLQKEMFDAMPVGVIVSWDHDVAPKNWLFVRDQKFSATEYPELAKLYPKLLLNDRRGTVDRALDAGRGYDTGRVLGSYQEDAMQKMVGVFGVRPGSDSHLLTYGSGLFSASGGGGVSNYITTVVAGEKKGESINFDNSLVARTANETRMKNVATNKIIKAR